MAETNLEPARRGYEAALRGDLDALRELLDPDVKWHGGDPSALGACRNREQALASGPPSAGEFMAIVREPSVVP